jgi:dihydrofolate synthase/folylpolyglutamate synthase
VNSVPDLAEVLAALYARVPLGMRLGLEPMREACARAGHPERSFDVVHVAGTNGKGSTCAMVAASARAAGVRTGLFTSPHLVRFAERIRIDGEPLDDEALARVLADALRIGDDLSFFETATLAAFLAFRQAGVRLGVIEVGIGGRLDATNVIASPKVTAITGVAFDHQDKLGDTLDAIAREKAGIAKRGVPMVLGPLSDEARRAAIDVATRAGARVVPCLDLPADVAVGLAGPHQRSNAGVAWTMGAELGWPEAVRARGIASVSWPGRLERIVNGEGEFAGTWILDGAHNPEGAEALVRALAGEDVGALVFGALADKAWREMLPLIAQVPTKRVYVEPRGRQPASPTELAEIAEGQGAPSVAEGLIAARRLAGDAPVVVAGSLYLVGEARALLLALRPDPIVAL